MKTPRLLNAKQLIPMTFAVIAYIILVVFFNDYLYAVENHSLWLNSKHFLTERLQQAGGLMMWGGCYLTQYFHYPYLGALMLVAIWAITGILTAKVFRLRKSNCVLVLLPVTALLCSEIDLGYWLYYTKIPGYWFTESIGLVVTLLTLYVWRFLKSWTRIVWMVVWCFCGYAMTGWYAQLATLAMMTISIAERHAKANTTHLAWTIVTGLLAISATPLIWYNYYTTIRIEDIWTAAFPVFQSNKTLSILPSAPFIIMALAIALMPFMKSLKGKALNIGTTTACAIMVYVFWFGDSNYHAELSIMRALEKRDWNAILDTMKERKGHPTRQMILVRNLALLNTGRLGEEMFTYDNQSVAPATYDSLKVRMAKTAAPEIYFQYGKTCFSYRWCIENGVEYGFDVNELRHLAKNSILNKEFNLALKYINLLKRTTFHKKEAMRLEAMVFNPETVLADEEMTTVMNLIDTNDMLDYDNSVCDIYLAQYFSQVTSRNPAFADLITSYTLFMKDNTLFWPRFMNYGIIHEGEDIPRHYVEAAYLFGNLDNSPVFNDLQFDMAMVQNYSNFQLSMYNLKKKGYSEKEIGEEMKKAFGKTYWWYYYFVTENKFY